MGDCFEMKRLEVYFIFNSIHHVLKAERLMKRDGLPCDLVPMPREITSDCGMALAVSEDTCEAVRMRLKVNLLDFAAFRKSGLGYDKVL